MKKLRKYKANKSRGFMSDNRVVLAALAGAITGLAVTYLLDSEKGKAVLTQVGSSVKAFAGKLKLPPTLRA